MKRMKKEYIYNFLKHLNENGETSYDYLNDVNNEYDLQSDYEIIDIIKENDLIRSKKNGVFDYDAIVYITEKGKNVLKFDSWKEYEESLKIDKDLEIKKQKVKDENDLLTNSELKYKEKIRNQQQRILDLDEQLKVFSLFKKYWYFIVGAITIGIAIAGFLF